MKKYLICYCGGGGDVFVGDDSSYDDTAFKVLKLLPNDDWCSCESCRGDSTNKRWRLGLVALIPIDVIKSVTVENVKE